MDGSLLKQPKLTGTLGNYRFKINAKRLPHLLRSFVPGIRELLTDMRLVPSCLEQFKDGWEIKSVASQYQGSLQASLVLFVGTTRDP